MHRTSIALVTGPAGVGKSTLCWEMSSQLAEAGVRHAVIDTDELDRVYPLPTPQELGRLCAGTTDVSRINLAALWATYSALGHTRLILAGVMQDMEADRGWINEAVPDARISVVRLTVSEEALRSRLNRREIGSGAAAQLERSLRQRRRMAAERDGAFYVDTSEKTPMELARIVLQGLGWLSSP